MRYYNSGWWRGGTQHDTYRGYAHKTKFTTSVLNEQETREFLKVIEAVIHAKLLKAEAEGVSRL